MKRSIVVAALGTAQTLAWGSSYYLPAILADPIAQGLGLSRTTVFGLFSGALRLSAVLGPSVGRAIDNRGGRGVLALSNLVLAAGLVAAFAREISFVNGNDRGSSVFSLIKTLVCCRAAEQRSRVAVPAPPRRPAPAA